MSDQDAERPTPGTDFKDPYACYEDDPRFCAENGEDQLEMEADEDSCCCCCC